MRVSIFMFCKNAVNSIRRSVDSLLAQTYDNIEIVVQDGASTDGTLEVLRAYGDRIKLVSEPDSGPEDGFWRALNRCTGDIIGSCLADEELLPNAVERVVEEFSKAPHLGALIGTGYYSDAKGKITGIFHGGEGDFNIVDYLTLTYCPLFAASFFSRRALLKVGLGNDDWILKCLEVEIWCRLTTDYDIKYIPEPLAKYAIHEGQLSNYPAQIISNLEARLELVEKLFSERGFFHGHNAMKYLVLYRQCQGMLHHLNILTAANKAIPDLDWAESEISARMNKIEFESVKHGAPFKSVNTRYELVWNAMRRLKRAIRFCLPDALVLAIPSETKAAIKGRIKAHLSTLLMLIPGFSGNLSPDDFQREYTCYPYHETARIFADRGQIDKAMLMWDSARLLKSKDIDSEACQALLKCPHATEATVRNRQLDWANTHARPLSVASPLKSRKRDPRAKIKVAHYCSTWESDYMKYQLLPVIREMSRDRFHVLGVSHFKERKKITGQFDAFICVGDLDDAGFVSLVRDEQVDILVETTGFSPFHRFSALGTRCAPVVVSYINHLATSGVPTVDYILADDISASPDLDKYYTEKIFRMRGCFFCFNYEDAQMPPVADEVPAVRNGYITFGCFGSGSKINNQLIEIWAAVLLQVHGSKLFLRNRQLDNFDNRRFMEKRFERFGVTPDRLIIRPGTDRRGILRSYADVDISLDTYPYCGGNTIAESLWQGVPVISLMGERFLSRYGASILHHCGCSDLVAHSAKQYADIAEALAKDLGKLGSYRRNLRQMCLDYGFADVKTFTRNLEDAYTEMFENAMG